MKRSIIFIIVIAIVDFCSAATFTVDNDGPADFNNIQAAVDVAMNGDTIIVAAGTYTGPGNYDIDFNGKAIVLKSQSGPADCVIDCQCQDCAFYFRQRETGLTRR